MRQFLIATALLAVTATAAAAGPIERACLASDRKAANRAVCGCLQQVADMTLRGAEQRKVAKFFKDPDRAQKVRMSKSSSDNALWERYKNFGATAEVYCAG